MQWSELREFSRIAEAYAKRATTVTARKPEPGLLHSPGAWVGFGENFAILSLGLVGLLVLCLNIHTLGAESGDELTTSASLLVVAFTGTRPEAAAARCPTS